MSRVPKTIVPNRRDGLPAAVGVAILLACATLALAADLPLSHWLRGDHLPKLFVRLCNLSEVFAHGLGVALIATAVFFLDPRRRWAVPRLLTAALGAGLVANIAKLLIARTRPYSWTLDEGILNTFGGWLPMGAGGSSQQSFPSGHAATAAGLAVALAWLYPHGRRFFVGLVMLALMQRMVAGAHYPSDVLAGAALGLGVARFGVLASPLGRAFDRWESRWRQTPTTDLHATDSNATDRPGKARWSHASGRPSENEAA